MGSTTMARFSRIQIHLHWLTLLLIAIVYAAMELRGWFPRASTTAAVMKTLHYNAGVAVWLLMFARIGLKHVYRTPIIVPAIPRWQHALSSLTHWVLYLTFLALPLLGIAILAYGETEWTLLGLTVPQFVTSDDDLLYQLKDIHALLANAGYFLIAMHAGAALFHHYIQRDNTLLRMMPGKSEPAERR